MRGTIKVCSNAGQVIGGNAVMHINKFNASGAWCGGVFLPTLSAFLAAFTLLGLGWLWCARAVSPRPSAHCHFQGQIYSEGSVLQMVGGTVRQCVHADGRRAWVVGGG